MIYKLNYFMIIFLLILFGIIVINQLIDNTVTIEANSSIDRSIVGKIETYDAKLSGISETECGTACTQGINCVGFGYNPINNDCYLSKSSILAQPMQSLYGDEYTKLDRRCNKINRITDERRIDGMTLTDNSVYICSDGENNIMSRFQYANLGATSLDRANSTIYARSDRDNIVPTQVAYNMTDIVWPKEKTELESIQVMDPIQ
jgi:hypothetical protein